MGVYGDMWVFCESKDGAFLPIALEMVGEARRLMDKYNEHYDADERVVAVIVGRGAAELGKQVIQQGADLAVIADHPELSDFRLWPYTRVVADAARSTKFAFKTYDKPRYFLFPATNNGRDLSATVAGALDTGLASDCNFLTIEDVDIKHPIKTGRETKRFERVLHMKRPDFSGFEWSTILCLDNPDHDYHPQCCSVIPGSFTALEPSGDASGEIVEAPVELTEGDLRVKVVARTPVEKGVDLTALESVVAVGRGIGDDPTTGIKLGVELAKVLGGDLGLSRGVVTANYQIDGGVAQYVAEERQIGETGQRIEPEVYVALGISGAIQHKVGMDRSKFVVTVNTDEHVPIRDFSDVFIKGDLFQVVPKLLRAVRELKGGRT